MEHLEIERKYLIRMPDGELLSKLPASEIEQIYILSPEGEKERIRRRDYGDRIEYTHTVKKRLNDLSRVEIEEEIDEERFRELRSRADPSREVIRKKRLIYSFDGQDFEIDVFPFWDPASRSSARSARKRIIRIPLLPARSRGKRFEKEV